MKSRKTLTGLFLTTTLVSILAASVARSQDTSTTPTNATDGIRFALLGGQVSLLGTPGDGGTNAFGLGVEASYKIEENLALAVRYLSSSHPSASHREFATGAEYAFEAYEEIAYPFLVGGISFQSNDLKNYNRSGDAVGIYAGAGVEFSLAPGLRLGPEFRFTKAFESRANVNGQDIDVVGSAYSFLARLIYSL